MSPAEPTTYLALLRGINVGKAKQVAMADLRDLLTDLGFGAVRTHLRSGNALFTADRATAGPAKGAPARIAARIEQAIQERLGMDVSVIVRTREELAAVLQANPLASAGRDPSRLFVAGALDPKAIADVDPRRYAPEEFALGASEIFMWLPDGMAVSELAKVRWDRATGLVPTARNWRTTMKLLELADA
jgi:uncharacterized protein (DUF1697 family)